jgi:hypothetical protein
MYAIVCAHLSWWVFIVCGIPRHKLQLLVVIPAFLWKCHIQQRRVEVAVEVGVVARSLLLFVLINCLVRDYFLLVNRPISHYFLMSMVLVEVVSLVALQILVLLSSLRKSLIVII